MSSRFVSGGTIAGDGATASTAPPPTASPPQSQPTSSSTTNPSASAWEKAQAQLEADRLARASARKAAVESGSGQSLYDVLQANKAAKQAAFEEANKIKNQFRALDDDEVDFLDDIAERERRVEEQKRRDEEFGLREFRTRQQKGSGVTTEAEEEEGGVGAGEDQLVEEWSTAGARKRKRERESVIKGIKRRASESSKQDADANGTAKKTTVTETTREASPKQAVSTRRAEATPLPAAAKSKMGLVDYGSDEDED